MDNVQDRDPKFESLVDTLRSHDRDRRQELQHLRTQNQMLQSELAKRNATIQSLQAQVAKLNEFKQSIVRSVKDPAYSGEINTNDMGGDMSAPYGGVGGAGSSGQQQDYVDGREFFVEAQRELPKGMYKAFLDIINDYNKQEVGELPFDQVRGAEAIAAGLCFS
jgi:hypothetical protein